MVVGIGALVLAQKDEATTQSGAATSTVAVTLDVASHNTRESCWTSINGSVYDLTSWIPQHPGGEAAILQLCGTDGSAKFNGKHSGSAQQERILAGFKIGAAGGAAASAAPAAPAASGGDDDSGRRGDGSRDDD